MLRFGLVALGVLALVSCGQPAPTAPSPAPQEAVAPQTLELSCAAFANATGDSMAQRFGAENMREETLPGAEGESYEATVIYPDDRARRLEIVWVDQASRVGIAQVAVSGEESGWVGPGGAALGMTLAQVQEANHGPFTLLGFGWDMGGGASDWRGGALGGAGCHVGMRFQPHGDYSAASGDREFASDAAEMRTADPRVAMIALSYPQK